MLSIPRPSALQTKIPPNLPTFMTVLWLSGVNPLALQSEQSDGAGSIPGRTPPLESHDKGSRTRLALSYFCNNRAGR